MARTYFVIMPFSTTVACTEDEWTWIFENIFKPAVEDAGLDYACRRSTATRGNIVAQIIQDLNDAHIVLADLTDRNANVFYELGVRHSLKNRSIILSQNSDHVPFDLRAYAYHVYEWRTDEGRQILRDRIRELLIEVDENPDRPDNPVSDFLHRTLQPVPTPAQVVVNPAEAANAQPLVGSGAEGLDAAGLARRLARGGSGNAATIVLRLTRRELRSVMNNLMNSLKSRSVEGRVQTSQIPEIAKAYISSAEHITRKIEEFALASIEEQWVSGVKLTLSLTGELISFTEKDSGNRFATGIPAFLAWRLILLMGAKSLEDEAFGALGTILREPITVEDVGGSFGHRPLPYRGDIFHPEVFLGYGDFAIDYMANVWNNLPYLHNFFTSEDDYQMSLAKFLFLVALIDARNTERYPLYPGYRRLPHVQRAISAFFGRLQDDPLYFQSIAQAMGENVQNLRAAWTARIERANSASLGGHYLNEARFPN